MRITFLMTTSIERPAGQRYVPIARNLVARGHTVRILTLHPDFEQCEQRRFVVDGVEVWYVGQMHARKHGNHSIHFNTWQLLQVLFLSTLSMIWAIVCSPSDCYHICKPQPINGTAAIIGVWLLRRGKLFVDCDDDEVLSNRLTSPLQRAVFAFFQRFLPKIADGVTVNTTFLARRMEQQHVSHVAYVPNGVDTKQFTRPSAQTLAALRTALRLDGCQVVAYNGTLALQNHPVDLLLEAFVQLASHIPTAVLLFIGSGEDKTLLQETVQDYGLADRVLFCGHVQRLMVPMLLSLADLSVDPVYDDVVARARSPLKLIESLSLGVPVVTGDVGDRKAVLGTAGWLCAAGNATALAEAISYALVEQTMLQQAGREALCIAPRYDWAVLTERWEELYQQSYGVVYGHTALTE